MMLGPLNKKNGVAGNRVIVQVHFLPQVDMSKFQT